MAKRKEKVEIAVPIHMHGGKIHFGDDTLMEKFAVHHDTQKGVAYFCALTGMTDKERCFAFLFGPVMNTLCIVLGSSGHGDLSPWEGYMVMKHRYGKRPWFNPVEKKEEWTLVDYSDPKTTLDELCQFIDNVCSFIEELGGTPPSSEAYNIKKRLGYAKRSF